MGTFWTADKIRMLWRYPDKMPEATYLKLPVLQQRSGYIVQAKLDGYRLVIFVDDTGASAFSRHLKPLPVADELLSQIRQIQVKLPAVLDAEWMKMRGGTKEQIGLLDTLYEDGAWVGHRDLYERRKSWYGKTLPSGIIVPAESDKDFLSFFLSQINEDIDPKLAISEGVVVKQIKAPLKGDRSKSAENPLWAKVKWRHGEAGDTITVRRTDVTSYLKE